MYTQSGKLPKISKYSGSKTRTLPWKILKGQVHGSVHAHALIKLLFSNLLLILDLSVNNHTHMYLNDLRVYFKVELYFSVTWSGMEEY